jgi:hypothetical protein
MGGFDREKFSTGPFYWLKTDQSNPEEWTVELSGFKFGEEKI